VIILASASAARYELLTRAGVAVAVDPADIDEDGLKHDLAAAARDTPTVALALAEAKASVVSARHRGVIVIGADQMLDCGDTRYDKPATIGEARTHLQSLRGRTHRLVSAVVAIIDGRPVWRHVAEARLTMRPFSEPFLDHYLNRAGDDVLHSVGAYRLEDLGAQLFSAVDGDYFTILGLPLLPLLDFLREMGELPR
jgi:septum formation protein